MARRLTYEFVKWSFESEGYTLLSTTYVGCYDRLYYICPEWHEHSSTWGNWQSGYRCPYCAGSIKKTFDEVKYSFESEGYTLLSKEYINSTTKLKCMCPEGHSSSISWADWNCGYRCAYCAGVNKYTIYEAATFFEKEGYTLLSTKYINNKAKLDYICPEGHTHKMCLDKFKQGRRCPTCTKINRLGSGNPNWRGGISFEPYCEAWKDKEYKQDIKDRDGNKCLNPYCYRTDSVLAVHHIDFNKNNCKPSNLITVCRSCNARANKDRKWHTAWYKAILKRRYNYEY